VAELGNRSWVKLETIFVFGPGHRKKGHREFAAHLSGEKKKNDRGRQDKRDEEAPESEKGKASRQRKGLFWDMDYSGERRSRRRWGLVHYL